MTMRKISKDDDESMKTDLENTLIQGGGGHGAGLGEAAIKRPRFLSRSLQPPTKQKPSYFKGRRWWWKSGNRREERMKWDMLLSYSMAMKGLYKELE